MADLDFYFDPVCPFAWLTSRWVHQVAAQRHYEVEWRFISLRIVNKDLDYEANFPPDYEAGHTRGLRLLRVAAATRRDHGNDAVGALYTAYGRTMFDCDKPADNDAHRAHMGTPEHLATVLDDVGLPTALADARDDESFDTLIEAETDQALALTGRDVGTPIIHFHPPDGCAFFGPVISRLPDDADAVRLWDNIIDLASYPGFSELKRSLREVPQLRVLGLGDDDVGTAQDWHGGSRRLKK